MIAEHTVYVDRIAVDVSIGTKVFDSIRCRRRRRRSNALRHDTTYNGNNIIRTTLLIVS